MATQIPFHNLPDSALLREKEMIPLLPWSAPTLWRRVKTGSFPQPIRLEGRITCWRWGDVRQWLDAQAQKVAA
ncbi:helix-turn-helix transcriptional regulator [Pseudoxanthomonas winnipegensis]|uniref:AlpA family phage regulatory protein n=1 Tax=Pseudoxanthomonas winnipegensis TaxID=2480810 RepID=A0A4Q8LEA4_9GAMM|nr:AlpA family phage regulatory protein [Pseudoxanthomonas winnipegensis]RZZ88917.1 AlpA family phage regulatory protein [Pseudoxanthomonas winnipegensis]TAA27374.1 AlpA family phage regulatory protein [Pseudoxanthomonas winnipegensis]TBV75660.1 AlpA family phage regulatory protein [Pseudoxanthomonas winnipegensis]